MGPLKHPDTRFIGGSTSLSFPPARGTCCFAPNICSLRRSPRRAAARRRRRRAFRVGDRHHERVSSDWAAARLGVAIERVAEALLVVEEEAQHIVPARKLLRCGGDRHPDRAKCSRHARLRRDADLGKFRVTTYRNAHRSSSILPNQTSLMMSRPPGGRADQPSRRKRRFGDHDGLHRPPLLVTRKRTSCFMNISTFHSFRSFPVPQR